MMLVFFFFEVEEALSKIILFVAPSTAVNSQIYESTNNFNIK